MPTIKQINKTKQNENAGRKSPALKRNKSEPKTNETLINHVTNTLFYKVDKNRRQTVGPYARINSLTKYKTEAILLYTHIIHLHLHMHAES